MKIAEFAVRRYQFTVVLFLMLAALGVASWFRIPRSEDPVFPIPQFTIIAVFPGATPQDMEQLVVDKIEAKLRTLERVKKLTSRAEDGLAFLLLEFEPEVDVDRKENEVLREITALRADLPAGLARLQVIHASSSNVSILQAALVSDGAPYAQLDSLAKQLEDRVGRLHGIKKAERWAAPDRQLQVNIDLERLARLGIPPGQLFQAVASDNATIPGGSVDAGARRFNLTPQGRYRTVEDVQRTVIGGGPGGVVRLGDVSDVRWGYADPVHIGRWNGRRAVFVTAALQEGFNISDVRARLWPELDAFEKTLPPGVTLTRGFDQAANVEHRLSRLGKDFGVALLLVLLTLLPGLAGRYIRSLPMAVIFAVVASLFVSVTIVPWLASLVLPEREAREGNRFLRLLESGIRHSYAPVLHRALAHPWRTLAVSGALVSASIALIPAVGFSLFPKAGTPQFLIDVETPEGASLTVTDSAARFVERTLARRAEIRGVFTNVGKDNPLVYYNVSQRPERSNRAQLFVLLKAYDPARTPVMIDSLRAQLSEYPGARIEVREFENGPPIDAPIAMRIEGGDLDTLRAVAVRVEQAMASVIGTRDVRNPIDLTRTDLAIIVDRQKAGLLGVATAELDRTVRLGAAGLEGGLFRARDGREYPIVLRVSRDGRPTPAILDRVQVASTTGAIIPLRQLATLGFRSSPTRIDHRDEQRAVTVTSQVRTGFNTDRVTRDVIAKLRDVRMPAGYRLVPAGEIESRQESFGGIGSAVIITTFAIMAILVLEFHNFRTTLVVASVIPLGVVGGIVALFLSGNTLSFTAMIGFVALIGIEIKTSILLVDFTDALRREGFSLDDAIQRAGEVRFVPIVLTTLTAIGGLLPLALQGSSLYSPLAWVIIGGLLSSTLIARLVTPVMYRMLAPPLADEARGTAVSPGAMRLSEVG